MGIMSNQSEFTELIETNMRALNRFVLGLVGNPTDAGDVVQETIVKAYVHFADFRAESKFKTWLMSIALNEVRQRRRCEMRSRISYIDADQLEHLAGARSEDSPYQRYRDQEAAGIMEEAVMSLHPSYRDIIRLRVYDAIDIADTANKLSISTSAAKARYHRAVHRLSETLARRTRRPLRALQAA
jgi:RNA polymerase sigma-70 factor, ECF subfamily